MEQRSEEWFNARLGLITGSQVSKVLLKPGSKTRDTYMNQLLTERIYQIPPDNSWAEHNVHVARGVALEPLAIAEYTKVTGNAVMGWGMERHALYAIGYSPDGLVGTDGMIEVKCPIRFSGGVPDKYLPQMRLGMYVMKRKWCDYVEYVDSQARIVRVHLNLPEQQNILNKCFEFLAELDNLYYTSIKDRR